MVERQLPKLHTTVRSRSPAPETKACATQVFVFTTPGLAGFLAHFMVKMRAGIRVSRHVQTQQNHSSSATAIGCND
jgi:hypothetical protein